jgi:hypothetical protein
VTRRTRARLFAAAAGPRPGILIRGTALKSLGVCSSSMNPTLPVGSTVPVDTLTVERVVTVGGQTVACATPAVSIDSPTYGSVPPGEIEGRVVAVLHSLP